MRAGDFSSFADSQDGQLKAMGSGEPVGKVTVARSKAEPFMDRVEMKNVWLVGTEHGLAHDGRDKHATLDVSIEWKSREEGAAGARCGVTLRFWPWLSYACAAGSRLKVTQVGHEFDGACVTVQRVMDDDRCVCTVDVVDKDTLLDPRPDNCLRTTRPSHAEGTRILMLHKATMKDATVLEWLGGKQPDPTEESSPVALGGRHVVRLEIPKAAPPADQAVTGGESAGETAGTPAVADELTCSLNEFNHSVQRFASAADFERCRLAYCKDIISSEDKVEDAITGNELRIEDQLICVAAQNIGETIKHADERWQKISDVHQLVELLLLPSMLRSRGVHLAQPTLVRAGPGTGKTWMVKQAAFLLAKRLSSDDCAKCKNHTSVDRPSSCEHGGMRLVPLLVYVQRIVRLVREQGDESQIIPALIRKRAMLNWYIENNFEGEQRTMLQQAHEMRSLIVLIDGVDEAAGMKEVIEDFVHKEVAVSGNRLVVTSRPEGVRLELYEERFIVINLLALSDEQQRKVINSQMQGNVFFDHLMSLSVIRKGQDTLFEAGFPSDSKARQRIEGLAHVDKYVLPAEQEGSPTERDPDQRQKDITGDHVLRHRDIAADDIGGQARSAHLKRLHDLLTSRAPINEEERAKATQGDGMDELESLPFIVMLNDLLVGLRGDASADEIATSIGDLDLPLEISGLGESERASFLQLATDLSHLILRKRTEESFTRILKSKRRASGLIATEVANAGGHDAAPAAAAPAFSILGAAMGGENVKILRPTSPSSPAKRATIVAPSDSPPPSLPPSPPDTSRAESDHLLTPPPPLEQSPSPPASPPPPVSPPPSPPTPSPLPPSPPASPPTVQHATPATPAATATPQQQPSVAAQAKPEQVHTDPGTPEVHPNVRLAVEAGIEAIVAAAGPIESLRALTRHLKPLGDVERAVAQTLWAGVLEGWQHIDQPPDVLPAFGLTATAAAAGTSQSPQAAVHFSTTPRMREKSPEAKRMVEAIEASFRGAKASAASSSPEAPRSSSVLEMASAITAAVETPTLSRTASPVSTRVLQKPDGSFQVQITNSPAVGRPPQTESVLAVTTASTTTTTTTTTTTPLVTEDAATAVANSAASSPPPPSATDVAVSSSTATEAPKSPSDPSKPDAPSTQVVEAAANSSAGTDLPRSPAELVPPATTAANTSAVVATDAIATDAVATDANPPAAGSGMTAGEKDADAALRALASPPLRRAPTNLSLLAGINASEPASPANPYLVEKALSTRYRENPLAMQDLFASWDTDHSGYIDLDEFRYAIKLMEIGGVTEADVDALFHIWDEDDSGEIDFSELNEGMRKAIKAENEARLEAITPAEPREKSFRVASFKVVTKKIMTANSVVSEMRKRHHSAEDVHDLHTESGAGLADGTVVPEAGSKLADGTVADAAARAEAAAAAGGEGEHEEEPTAVHELCLAEVVWGDVVSRTDELYEVLEKLHPAYHSALSALLKEESLPAQLLEKVELRNPIEVHTKAVDQYDKTFPRRSGLPEACVHDVLRAEMVCEDGEQMVKIAERLIRGYDPGDASSSSEAGAPASSSAPSKPPTSAAQKQAETPSLEVVHVKNDFALLTPTHFRQITFTLKVEKGSVVGYAELKLHHAPMRKYDQEEKSDEHYSFFRTRMSQGQVLGPAAVARIDATLERVLTFLIEAAAVPVLLSLLVLVFTTTTAVGEEDLDMLPQSAYELYAMATQSAVVNRLLAMKKKDLAGVVAHDVTPRAAGGGKKDEPEDEATKRPKEKVRRKEALVKAGTATAKGESASDLGLADDEVYRVYRCVAKILHLLAQGRQGLSELKQQYLPKDKRLRPLISKMLDNVSGGKLPKSKLEAAGLNMLRLVAVDNQRNGRREFSSLHVANSLALGGGDVELPLWLRLDAEDAGVTLIKTLEGMTDGAPAMYQFKHLSFQEGLFARNLLGMVDKQQWKGWQNDGTAAEFLNNAYMNNVCRIAAGELGKRLATLRPEWDFGTAAANRLSWVGKTALWNLLKSNAFIVSVNLSRNDVGPGPSGSEVDMDAKGLGVLFSTCKALQKCDLSFNRLGQFTSRQLGHFVKGLSGNATITELDLQSNGLGPDGVKSVANALLSCSALRVLNLSRNQPGGRVESLVQLVKEHKALRRLGLVEDDEKHLTSKAKSTIGAAVLRNPAHKLTFVSCDAFELSEKTRTLKWTSTLPADVTLLAGALRSNSTLTTLSLEGASIAEAERTQLGRALLENEAGVVGYCDDFDLTPASTELRWDLKDGSKARKGVTLLMGLLRANKSLTKLTMTGMSAEAVPLLAQAMRHNTTLQTVQIEQTVQNVKGSGLVTAMLPVQDLTGSTGKQAVDLSAAGELSKTSCASLGALLAHNTAVTSLQLSGTKLGDEAGGILQMLGEQCRSGSLSTLDLSSIGLTDRGARKLFEAVASGEFSSLRKLVLSGNSLKDQKANGLLEMLRAEETPLTMLDLSHNPLSGAVVLRALRFNTTLTYINVCGTELDDEGVRDFGELLLQDSSTCPIKLFKCDDFEVGDGTSALSFEGKAMRSSVLTLISGILRLNETVVSLDLSGAGIDATAAKSLETSLRTNKTLTRLDVRGNEALWRLNAETGEEDCTGLDALARGLCASSSMSMVLLDKLELKVKTLKGAEEPAAKELLYAACDNLSNLDATLLCALVEANGSALRLDLSRNKSASRLGHAVGRCLKANATLTSVQLHECDLKDEGVSALADGLRHNSGSSLSVLDLASNGIGAKGAERLAALLGEVSCSLKKLDLGSNSLGRDGAAALMPSLKTNASLTALSLRENDIDVGGASAIASAITVNTALTTLWLGKNKLQNDGVEAIAEAVVQAGHKSALAMLDLHKNNISKPAVPALTRLIGESHSLVALALAGSKLQFIETEAMQQAAKENPQLGRSKPVRLWMGSDMNKWPDL